MELNFFEQERAQISAEMIVVMAAVLAVAMIMIKGLSNTATRASSKVSNETDDLISEMDNISDVE